ncbi:MAG: DUF1540 domain-containing protein [Oscillospiraceae bacterium]|nr:DUF1540 domain-containing protein [Oscillospiraceae bacterium]
MKQFANKSIGCTINNCINHCQERDYCSLKEIHIGAHESNPTLDECTDCKSFQRK